MADLDKGDLRIFGFAALVLGVFLVAAGLFSALYSDVSSTPDPPWFYSTNFPYAQYSVPLLVGGVVSLSVGVILLVLFYRSKKPH